MTTTTDLPSSAAAPGEPSSPAVRVPVTVAPGDGIGPEIMAATLRVLEAAGARLDVETIQVGEKAYRAGVTSGIPPEAWESIRRTGVLLKGPITTPQGGGVKSLNVTLRKTLGLYANLRPCRSYAPWVPTRHPGMDLVVVRENEEDLYAGIEHRQTAEVVQCLKLITRPGCERIVRFAFEYARRRDRRKVTCLTKDNIMKLTDGLFHRVFDEVAAQYPDLESEHMIVDAGMARMARHPERFDVVVMPNLYGDIASDVVAELSGSLGLAPSANIGDGGALFEAIHGSAPDIAGRDVANPSGLLLSAVKMLAHVGQGEVGEAIHNAWLCTLEDGVHTLDVYAPERSERCVGTDGLASAVIERLGRKPRDLEAVHYGVEKIAVPYSRPAVPPVKELVGVDVFVDWPGETPDELARALQGGAPEGWKLQMITNRGVKVWPDGFPETFCTDHWRCRFVQPEGVDGDSLAHRDVVELLAGLARVGVDFIKTEHLYTFDGEAGFSLGQGQ